MTAMQDAVTQIAATVDAITGVTAAAYPPEGTNRPLTALVYPQTGGMAIASDGNRHSLWDINIDLLRTRNNMADDMRTLVGVLDPIKNALAAEVSTGGDQFSNTLETFLALRVEFIPDYVYQNVQYICYRFTMVSVKFIE